MKKARSTIRLVFKDLLFPGIDYGLRKRIRLVRKFLSRGPIKSLDAGCGNGAFGFLCYQLGNSVIGVDLNNNNIRQCLEYRDYKHISILKARFVALSIYSLLELNESFDQIVCFEALEHLLKDREVLRIFSRLLHPGGVLHLGVPNLNCPDFYGERVSATEDGAHVRKGYTYDMLENMCADSNLEVVKKGSYGGFFTRQATSLQRKMQGLVFFNKLNPYLKEVISVSFFLLINPFTWLDNFFKAQPMSIYIMARKR